MPEQSPTAQRRVVALVCLAETLSMTGFAAYPAFLPTLREAWAMNGAEAGLAGGALFFGYMLAVPLLSGITDRLDARQVFVFSCALAAAGSAGFAWLAQGVISATLLQALVGAGLAGTYMPGLKALTDRLDGPRLPRYISFYTATFGLGTSLSLLLSGGLGARLDWPAAFALLALGPAAAALVFLAGIAPRRSAHAHLAPWLPRFYPVLAQREMRRYVLGYAAHCWELFGLRSWMVAFLVFAYAGHRAPPLSATDAAAVINLLGLPASILGNECAGRIGRRRWITLMMLASGMLCWISGFASGWPWWLMFGLLSLYFAAAMADSAALTAGLIAAAPLHQRGAAMAVYSLFGFGAGFAAPLVFGATLDLAGDGALAWGLAFGSLGLWSLLWAIIQAAQGIARH